MRRSKDRDDDIKHAYKVMNTRETDQHNRKEGREGREMPFVLIVDVAASFSHSPPFERFQAH